MNEQFGPYIDSDGLLKGSQEDPGDSLHRTMFFYVAAFILHRYKSFNDEPISIAFQTHVNKYRTLPGIYCRHPSYGWWSEPDRMSRDQSTPLVIAMALAGRRILLNEFFLAHAKRFFFFTNTRRNGSTKENHGQPYKVVDGKEIKRDYSRKTPDIAGLEFMAIYIRTLGLWYLYPLLYILDLETLIGSLLWRFFRKDDTDILNHLVITRYAGVKYCTLWISLSLMIENRPAMHHKLWRYFTRVGLPPLASLWQSLL